MKEIQSAFGASELGKTEEEAFYESMAIRNAIAAITHLEDRARAILRMGLYGSCPANVELILSVEGAGLAGVLAQHNLKYIAPVPPRETPRKKARAKRQSRSEGWQFPSLFDLFPIKEEED